MDVHLTIETRDGRRRRFPVPDEGRTIIGRETTCDLRVPLPSVAVRHCELTYRDGTLELEDLGSGHGTYLNGAPVGDRVRLAAADEITIGSVTFRIEIEPRA